MTVGKNYPVYVNDGTYSSPEWVRLCRISEVSISRSKSTNDVMLHCSTSKKKAIGYKENSVTMKYTVKKTTATGVTDTVFDMISDSFENDTVLDMAFMNGTLTASTTRQGYRGPMICTKLDRSQADEEAVTYDLEFAEVEDEQSGNIWDFGPYQVVTGA
jgi:hypothetical protein